jgi:hypothetical protein
MHKAGLGAQLSTPARGVYEQSQHGVAHRKRRQDEQKREGFSLSSAPGGEKSLESATKVKPYA